ncbi:hypothetical protein CANTEDRAFT_113891, partial [Yamadazyma tenuis ATCC 10573]
MSQYIGKTISLISNKQLRYVGVLDNISAEDATIALKSVRSFGTEGRFSQAGQPNLEVAPGNDIYDYVVFRGNDVKDLSVLDAPLDQITPEPTPTPTPQPGAVPHAPVQTAAPVAQPHQASPQRVQPTPTTTEPPTKASPAQPVPAAVPEPSNAQPKTKSDKKLEYTEDFDFETANSKFVKEIESEKEKPTYQKSSFF